MYVPDRLSGFSDVVSCGFLKVCNFNGVHSTLQTDDSRLARWISSREVVKEITSIERCRRDDDTQRWTFPSYPVSQDINRNLAVVTRCLLFEKAEQKVRVNAALMRFVDLSRSGSG